MKRINKYEKTSILWIFVLCLILSTPFNVYGAAEEIYIQQIESSSAEFQQQQDIISEEILLEEKSVLKEIEIPVEETIPLEEVTNDTIVQSDSLTESITLEEQEYLSLMESAETMVCELYVDSTYIGDYDTLSGAINYAIMNFNDGNFIINMLVEEYFHKGGEYDTNIWNIQGAHITIQTSESLLSQGKICTIKRGEAISNLFAVETMGELTLKDIIIDGENKIVPGRLIYSSGNVTLERVEIKNAYNLNGPAKGGAIRMELDSGRELIIRDSLIHSNIAEGESANGAAISGEYCKITIANSKLYDNQVITTNTSGGGGAIYVHGQFKDPVDSAKYIPNLLLTNVEITGNQVSYQNIVNELDKRKVGGGAIAAAEHVRVELANCQIQNNQAPVGGGIYLFFGRVDLKDNTIITQNTAEKVGGGIYFSAHSDAKRFSMQGKVVIDKNTAVNPKFTGLSSGYPENPVIGWGNNVFLQNEDSWGTSAQSISLAGNLTIGSSIGITAMDSVGIESKNRMKPDGQFGKAISNNLDPMANPDPTVEAILYSGWNYFYRDTNGYEADGKYLYGAPGEVTSALYQTHALIWKEVPSTVDFTFKKETQEGFSFGLEEASFQLKDENGTLFGSSDTDDTGLVTFSGLNTGMIYYLYETKTKPGYALPRGYWRIQVDYNTTIQITAVSEGGIIPEFIDNNGDYLVINYRQLQLPMTGSYSFIIVIIAGIILIYISVLLRLKYVKEINYEK